MSPTRKNTKTVSATKKSWLAENAKLFGLLIVLIVAYFGLKAVSDHNQPPSGGGQPRDIVVDRESLPGMNTQIPALVTDNHEVSLSAPNFWGEATVDSDLALSGGSVMSFGHYPYLRASNMTAATISTEEYPAQFVDDEVDETGPWWGSMTAEDKEAQFAPLLAIYEQGSIAGLDIAYRACNATEGNAPTISPEDRLRFGWWGNTHSYQERMNIHYLETEPTDELPQLRGVGFFANVGQECIFYPEYNFILINPELRIVVSGHFLLWDMPELKSFEFQGSGADAAEWQEAYRLTDEGNQYLENFDLESSDTELGRFLGDIREVVRSIQVRP